MFNFSRENTGLVATWWRNVDKQILFFFIFLFFLGLFFSFSSTSLVIAENTKFNNIDYPFASYRKKKEFQGSKIFIQKNFSKNFIKKYLKDDSSIIKIDGKFQNDINKNILKLIYINT